MKRTVLARTACIAAVLLNCRDGLFIKQEGVDHDCVVIDTRDDLVVVGTNGILAGTSDILVGTRGVGRRLGRFGRSGEFGSSCRPERSVGGSCLEGAQQGSAR